MKKIMLVLLVMVGLVSATQHKPGYELVWSDEFNYTGLPDAKKWNYDVGGHGWGNAEEQYYTKARKENARVEDGHLIIEARREPMEKNAYTSARLVTKGIAEWQYGKVEVRAKIPAGRGTWPAIWMLGATDPLKWPDDGEIDIMEHVGFDQGRIHGTVHCKNTTIPSTHRNQHRYHPIPYLLNFIFTNSNGIRIPFVWGWTITIISDLLMRAADTTHGPLTTNTT